MSEKYDVIIIGAGLSGLLSASLLSKKGLKVCILEKNNNVGGMIQPFKREALFLDTGMNFFGAYKKNQIQNKFFEIFDIAEKIQISEIKAFEVFSDKKKYHIPTNFDAFEKKMIEYFPEERNGIEIYVEKIKTIINSLYVNFFSENDVLYKYYDQSASVFINSISTNKKLRSLLKFNTLLFGGNFEKTSLYIYAMITGSFLKSSGMFTNGTNQFIEVLKNNITENKGIILFKKDVKKILSDNESVTECVCEDGSVYSASNFLSTIHPQNLFPKIESSKIKMFYRTRISKLQNTQGVLIINVILKEKSYLFDKYPKFINSNSSLNFKSILLYSPVSTKNGKYSKTLKIMVEVNTNLYEKWIFTKSGKRDNDYYEFIKKQIEVIFIKIEQNIPSFTKKVKTYYVSSPLSFRDFTGSPNGTAYGILHDFNNPSGSMISVKTKLKNLYLAGQSINFHGLLGVSVTSLLACSLILNAEITE